MIFDYIRNRGVHSDSGQLDPPHMLDATGDCTADGHVPTAFLPDMSDMSYIRFRKRFAHIWNHLGGV